MYFILFVQLSVPVQVIAWKENHQFMCRVRRKTLLSRNVVANILLGRRCTKRQPSAISFCHRYPIVSCHSSLFGHIARLPDDTPAHQALRCHIDLSLGRLPDPSWRRCPGRPRNRWLDQLRRDNSTPPADLWRRAAVTRGHSGVTLRSSTTTR